MRMHGAPRDDSQGKSRGDSLRRAALLVMAFAVGITFGVVISQRMYVEAHRTLPNIVRQDPALSATGGGREVMGAGTATTTPADFVCTAVKGDCALEAFLRKAAPGREVLVAISNFNLIAWGGMLNTWIERVKKAGVPNYMVLAIDEQLHKYLDERGVPNYYLQTEIAGAQKDTGSNHAVSALKFGILAKFLELGWSVLLSDVDVVTLQDPFPFLHRDRDIEGMTDGFDDATAYGHIEGLDDPTMGWARYAQSTMHMNLNSGLFYVRANGNTVELMRRLEDRLSKTKYWDQTAFNEEIFFLSHGDKSFVPISVRVMDYMLFMNSKVFFKKWRHMAEVMRKKPVMVHVNYHPDKHERMQSMIQYFDKGNVNEIMRWPGGSEPGTR